MSRTDTIRSRTDTMRNWVHDTIAGVGGFTDYRVYEMPLFSGCGDNNGHLLDAERLQCEAVVWALGCLTSPEYATVLAAVNKRAQERLGEANVNI